MGQVIEFPRPEATEPPDDTFRWDFANRASADRANDGLGRSVGALIETLEASHLRIRMLIDGIPDRTVALRLSRDLMVLSAALRDAKRQAIASGLLADYGTTQR